MVPAGGLELSFRQIELCFRGIQDMTHDPGDVPLPAGRGVRAL